MNLTDHFTLGELCESDTATRKNIDNTPNAEVQSNLLLLARGLERVRSVLSVPLHISSGYRSPKLNAAIGGSKNSAHMKGLAADFVAPQFGTPYDIAAKLAMRNSEIGFDQVIQEGRWVHIAFPEDGHPKGEVLTAKFNNGVATYTKGLS